MRPKPTMRDRRNRALPTVFAPMAEEQPPFEEEEEEEEEEGEEEEEEEDRTGGTDAKMKGVRQVSIAWVASSSCNV